jgi:hypothetical protein
MDTGNILGDTVPSLSRFQEKLSIPDPIPQEFGREDGQIEGRCTVATILIRRLPFCSKLRVSMDSVRTSCAQSH